MRNYYQQKFFHNFNASLDVEAEQQQKQRLLADKINNFATIDELRLLLVQGAQADGVVTLGLRPLHYAVYRQHFDAAKLLIVRGAKVDAVDEIGYSALHLCAEKGSYRMLKLLLEHLVNRNKCLFFESKDQPYPIRDGPDEPLRLAIWQNHYECAKLLLETGADPNIRYFDGPQITLVELKDIQYIRLLLDFGANVNVFNRKGVSPLMSSCECGAETFQTTRLLIERGADVNAVNRKTGYPMSVLHYAVGSGDLKTVQLLLEHGAQVNFRSEEPERPLGSQPPVLHYSIMSGNVEIARLLLEYGADVYAAGTIYGNSLHLAACHRIGCENHVEMVQLLLEFKANPNSVCSNSNGVLLRSPVVEFFRRLYKFEMEARPGNPEWVKVVKLLFGHGAYFDITYENIEVESMNITAEHRRTSYAEILSDYAAQIARAMSSDVEQMGENSVYLTPDQLKQLAHQPRSLRELCRKLIRLHVPVKEKSFLQFPLPLFVRKYLLGYTDLL